MVESSQLDLSIVFTTSPMISNPAPDLIIEVVHSFTLVPGLIDCPLYIVCDGCKVLSDAEFEERGKFNRRKKGWINESQFAKYREYIQNL